MSNTAGPYEVAAQALVAELVGPSSWDKLSAPERARYLRAAERTTKAFHKARKAERDASTARQARGVT